MEAPRVDTGLQNPNGARPAAEDRAGGEEPMNCERLAADDRPDDRADNQGEPPNFVRPAADNQGRAADDQVDENRADDRPDDRAENQDVQGEPPNFARPAADDQDRAAEEQAADDQVDEDRAAGDRADEDRAGDGGPHHDDQDVQGEPRRFWLYIAGGFSLIFIVAFVVVFHFDSEISKKEADVRVCDSQQKDLQNKVEGCMADLSETHGEVYQLNLMKTATSGTIACLENEVEDYKTRLSEKVGEYNHLQDEYRKKWQEKEQLEQENKAKTETIEAKTNEVEDYKTRLSEKVGENNHLQDEYRKKLQEKEQLEQENKANTETIKAKTKEIDNLKAELSEMRNERDRAKNDYGKEKQENEKCTLKLSSETKMVQELNMKLKAAEKRCYDQKESGSGHEGISGYEGIIGFVVMLFVIMGCIALCVHNSK